MTIIISERALEWVERWHQHGGTLGSNDKGQLTLIRADEFATTDDPVADDMVAELRGDQGLADGVGFIFLLMIKRQNEEEGRTS